MSLQQQAKSVYRYCIVYESGAKHVVRATNMADAVRQADGVMVTQAIVSVVRHSVV